MDLNMPALGPGKIVAGDFNEDGKQDLIIATVGGLQSDLLLVGNGDGTFTQLPDIPNSGGFSSAVLADVNGDKHLDLISAGNPAITVYLGDGRGGFQNVGSRSGVGILTGIATGDSTTTVNWTSPSVPAKWVLPDLRCKPFGCRY